MVATSRSGSLIQSIIERCGFKSRDMTILVSILKESLVLDFVLFLS